MKLNGFVGKGSGKLGSSVFAISGGEQIVREYNPRVANPNTDAQVEQRAKLKLMSQLAAALAQGLAFKRMGLVSARNQFVAKNIGLCGFSDDKASMNLLNLKLTNGNAPFNNVEITTEDGNYVNVSSINPFEDGTKKVVIVFCELSENDKILVRKVVVSDVEDGEFSATCNIGNGKTAITYVYGWKPTNSNTYVNYADYEAIASNAQASLEAIIKEMLQNGVFSDTIAQKDVLS